MDVKECPICRKRIDDFNVHMLICSTKKSLMQHHDAISHCVKELCNAAELHVDVEASPFGKRDTNDNKEKPETPRPHHPQPDKKKGFQSCN